MIQTLICHNKLFQLLSLSLKIQDTATKDVRSRREKRYQIKCETTSKSILKENLKKTRDVNGNTCTNQFTVNATAVKQSNAAMITKLIQDYIKALKNLVNVTRSDWGSIATLV